MEKIGLHNYEAFFLDHLEGNLSPQQEFELMDFLDKHPELKAELDMDLDELSLEAETVSLDKSILKKEGIQAEDADEMMIASVEGILDTQEQAELSAYVKSNDLQRDLKYYQSTVLKPNLSEGYGNKRKLKKRNRFAPIFFPILGAAAIAVTIWSTTFNEDAGATVLADTAFEVEETPVLLQPKVMSNHLFARAFYGEVVFEEIISNSIHEDLHSTSLYHSAPLNTSVGSSVSDQNKGNGVPTLQDNASTIGGSKIETTINNEGQPEIDKSIDSKSINQNDNDIIEPNKTQEIILDKKTRDQQKKDQKGGIVTEEPIKVITNIAGNVFNKDVSYKRDRNTNSNETVSHHVKIGKFEFQRKKH
jgi:hypothetical protein